MPTYSYGSCSRTCGSFGTKTQTKSWTVYTEPENGGQLCKRDEITRIPCNRIACPGAILSTNTVNCWQTFTLSYGPCSETCGANAKRTVTKSYTVHREPTTGGKPCKDDETWKQHCNRLSKVTGYGPCSSTCGPGVMFKQFVVTETEDDKQGYQQCASNFTWPTPHDCQNGPCPGARMSWINHLPSVDCIAEVAWTNSSCSSSCGPGTRTMVSTVNIITEAEHNGKACQKAQNLTEACYVEECPGINIPPVAQKSGFSV